MLLIQVSNILNDFVQADPDINFFHCGLPNDVNVNIPNNYDPNSRIGNQFPYVLLIPPIVQGRVEANGDQGIFETFPVDILISDLYGQTNSGVYGTNTYALLLSKLQVIAQRIVKAFQSYAEYASPQFNVGDYTLTFDSLRHTQNTRSLRLQFDLIFALSCSDYTIDLSTFATDAGDTVRYDKEDPINTTPV